MMLLTGPTASSIPAAFVITTVLGFAGGPLYPVHGILKRDWMPQSLGSERAMALRATIMLERKRAMASATRKKQRK